MPRECSYCALCPGPGQCHTRFGLRLLEWPAATICDSDVALARRSTWTWGRPSWSMWRGCACTGCRWRCPSCPARSTTTPTTSSCAWWSRWRCWPSCTALPRSSAGAGASEHATACQQVLCSGQCVYRIAASVSVGHAVLGSHSFEGTLCRGYGSGVLADEGCVLLFQGSEVLQSQLEPDACSV